MLYTCNSDEDPQMNLSFYLKSLSLQLQERPSCLLQKQAVKKQSELSSVLIKINLLIYQWSFFCSGKLKVHLCASFLQTASKGDVTVLFCRDYFLLGFDQFQGFYQDWPGLAGPDYIVNMPQGRGPDRIDVIVMVILQ